MLERIGLNQKAYIIFLFLQNKMILLLMNNLLHGLEDFIKSKKEISYKEINFNKITYFIKILDYSR